jgi:glycosyltransferase involved in cell wall biosynthesis
MVTQETPLPGSTLAHGQPLLVCLLPARNAARDLPGYLASVSTYCDAVVALDDGSTDDTFDILRAHPIVKVLLRNPLRPDYRDWDDAANRNQLLAAAEALNPEWLISLDADERIDERDAMSLREFLQTDALPGFAYGFRHVPMRNDDEHFLPRYEWIYRLFSAGQGQRFPSLKLHFVPVPTSIPRNRWIRTTLRIQHLGEITVEHRLARFNKYLEADPLRKYQTDYSHLVASPAREDVRRWQPRPATMPVLLEGALGGGLDEMGGTGDPTAPSLSAIIISRNNEATIADTVTSVINQDVPEPFEVILVTSGTDRTASIVREQFPEVTVIELSKPALPGEARNAGMVVARGKYITFPSSHMELLPGSLAARLKAHQRGYAMVSGVVSNGTPTPAGWGSYFLDHVEGMPGHGRAEFNGPPGDCSYASLPLLEVGWFPEGVRTAEDTAVNMALVRRGYVAYRDPGVRLIHHSRCTTVPRLVRHHFQRGRGLGRLLVERHLERGHLLNRHVLRTRLLEAVPKRLQRIEESVMGLPNTQLIAEYQRFRHLVVLGALATLAGTWYEVLRPAPGKLSVLVGRPVEHFLLVSRGGEDRELALVHVDHVSGQTTKHVLSPDLLVPHDGSVAALRDVLDAGDGRSRLEDIRQVLRTALNLEGLECIVVPESALAVEPSSGPGERPASFGLREALEQARGVIGMMEALRRGAMRSTMSPWGTIRVLSCLHRMGGG